MSAQRLASFLEAHGLRVTLWRDQRVYVRGYGRDICCYIEPDPDPAKTLSADGAFISVCSNWRSPHAGLRCKGVKHALLCDLHALGLLDQPPPEDWRRVTLNDRFLIPRLVPDASPPCA